MTEKPLTPAVGYIRMSTDQQEDSPDRQRAEIVRMADANGYQILHWYEDHGLTGTESKNRPQFQQLLKDAPKGRFSAVLMYEQSRFSREDVFDAMEHWKQLKNAGVKLVTCQRGELRFDDLAGLITALVGQHEARGESIRIAQRTLSGRLHRARSGVHTGPAPFGYDRVIRDEQGQVARVVKHGERFRKPKTWSEKIEPAADADAIDAVRFAFKSAAEGASLRSIAIELNRRGWKGGHGKPFKAITVKQMLSNPVYAGILRFGHKPMGKFARCDDETVVIPNAHPAIISLGDFELTQRVLRGAFRSRGKSEPGRYLLSGLVHCEHCGEKMVGCQFRGTTYKDGTYRQYRCRMSQTGLDECAVHPSIGADDLERALLRLIADRVLCDENRDQLLQAAAEFVRQSQAPRIETQQLEALRRQIERGERNLAIADAEDFPVISRQLKEWRKRERDLLARLATADSNSEPSADSLRLMEDLAALRANLHLADRVPLASAIRETISRIVFGRRVVTHNGLTMHQIHVQVVLQPSIYTGGPITLGDTDVYPNRGDVRAAEYVSTAGRPVAVAELAEVLGVFHTTARYHAQRAAAAGLIGWSKQGSHGWRFTPKPSA